MTHLQSTAAAAEVTAGPPALAVRDLVMRFGGVTAVDRVTFDIMTGERMAVIGPNGAGKTTLFKTIAGELRATSGTIELFGHEVVRHSDARRARAGLSRTFQVSNLFGALTVRENVALAVQSTERSQWRMWPASSERRRAEETEVRDALQMVGLGHRWEQSVQDLSHGEQRQLEIAMALVNEPRLLLLDEPAAGLSQKERVVIRELISSLPRTLAVLLIEHDMSFALDLTDKVLCMNNGVPIALGSADHIRSDALVRDVYLGRAGSDAGR